MNIDDLTSLYRRDLSRLAEEIMEFEWDEQLWVTRDGITNPAGNLCLHINGNLNHFIGAVLGQTGYVRDREYEFSGRDRSRHQLAAMTQDTLEMLVRVLGGLDREAAEQDYPLKLYGETWSTGLFLLHLYGHLNYHLGQINYLRRVIES